MFSTDGRVLAAGSGYGTGGQVQIWRAPSWAEINAIEKNGEKRADAIEAGKVPPAPVTPNP